MPFTRDTVRVSDLVGRKIYAAKDINTYYFNKKVPKWLTKGIFYKKFSKGSLIGTCTGYYFTPKVINKKADAVALFFVNGYNKEFGFRYFAGDINMKSILEQGVITEGQRWDENKAKYNSSPLDSIKKSLANLTKNKLVIPAVLFLSFLYIQKNNNG